MEMIMTEPSGLPGKLETGPDSSGDGFQIVIVYQGTLAQDRARQMCHPVRQKFGGEYVQDTWHEVNSLGNTEILLEAVRAALTADVIVIAVQAADELPPELCVWIDLWLPRRRARAGALAALIGVAGQPEPQAARTQEYLQAVARRGQLDFMPYEHPRQTDPGEGATPFVAGRSGSGRVFRLTPDGQAEFRF
jgi:hypothetical protein